MAPGGRAALAARLAASLEIEAIHLVVNGVRDEADRARTRARLDAEGGFPFASRHWLPWDERLRRCEPDIGPLLPAMGYGDRQIRDLEKTVNAVECDLVIVATPIDLTRLLTIERPHMHIGYRLEGSDGAITKAIRSVIS